MSSSVSDFGQNTWLVEEMYQQFIKDPASVDPSWHEVLKNYKPESADADAGAPTSSNGNAALPRPSRRLPPRPPQPGPPPLPPGHRTGSARSSAPGEQSGHPRHRSPTGSRRRANRHPPERLRPPRPPPVAARRRRPQRRRQDPAAPAADENKILRGPAAAIVKNMNLSLQIPTATSVRAIPAKLMIDNRIVINNHLARTRGGKISFTHILGYAIVQAIKDFPI